MQGQVLEVSIVPSGDELDVAHAAGATTLQLTDVSEFDSEGGGSLRVDSIDGVADPVDYDYDAVDTILNTVHILTGLAADAEEGRKIFTLPLTEEKWAKVEIQDDGDTKLCRVHHSLQDRMVDGVREPEDQETVTIEMIDGDLTIVNIIDEIAQVDAGYQIPGTAPDSGGGPTLPPASSPTLTTTGFKDAITVEAHGVVDPTTTLDYYIDGVLAESTHSPIMLFRSTPAGVQFQPNTEYIFSVQARNGIAPDPAPSPGVIGVLNPNVDSETVLGIVKAGFALLGSLTIGKITIKPPSGTPGQPDYDPGGIVIPTTAGTTIKFPADGSSAVIEAILRTADMIVSGGLTINGLTNWINGRVLLGSGTPDPDTKPSLSYYGTLTDRVFATATYTEAQTGRGLCQTADGTRWAFTKALTPDQSKKKLVIVNDSDGSVFTEIHSDDALLHMVGVTCVGNTFYVLGYRWNAAAAENQYRIHTYNKSGGLIDQWWITDINGARITNTVPGGWEDGAIAADNDGAGPGIYVAKIRSTYRLRVHQFNPGSLQVGSEWQQVTHTDSPSDWLMDFTSGGFYVGEADYGVGNKRWYIGGRRTGSSTAWGVFAFNLNATPFTLDSAKDFAVGYSVNGLTYEGGKFLSLLWSSTRAFLGKYSSQKTDTPIFAKYSWYDSNATGGNKESKGSPEKTITVPKRAWPMFSVPKPPLTGAGNDIADRVAFYLGSATGDANLKRVAIYDGSEGDTALDVFVGAGTQTPLPASTFPPAASSGSIESLLGGIILKGDGSWKLGDLVGTVDGRFTFPAPVVLTATGSTYTGSITLIRLGQVVHAFGYVDRASGFSATLHNPGLPNIPSGLRPAADVVGKASPSWSPNGAGPLYRYRFNADGTIQVQQSAAIGVFQAVHEMWILS